jgi:hypothetical protein
MINDLTNEPIEHAADRMMLVKMTFPKLAEQYPVEGESYHELRTAFSSLMREYHRAAITLSRFIGGVQVERAFHGQEGATKNPLIPVDAETQQSAMNNLSKHVFGADAINFPPDLIARLQMQRRGFDFFDLDDNEDPKIHDRVLDMQKSVLDQILHKHTLARILDTSLYGNEYSLEAAMNSLDSAIMEGDPADTPSPLRESLQLEYINRLIKISGMKEDSAYPGPAKSQAVVLLEKHLDRFEKMEISAKFRQRVHLKRLIGNALEGR